MKVVSTIIKLFLLLVFLALAYFNRHNVQFIYLPGQELTLPLIVVLFGAFVVGTFSGVFALLGKILRLRSENNRLRGEVKKNARLSVEEMSAPTAKPTPAPVVSTTETASEKTPAQNS